VSGLHGLLDQRKADFGAGLVPNERYQSVASFCHHLLCGHWWSQGRDGARVAACRGHATRPVPLQTVKEFINVRNKE